MLNSSKFLEMLIFICFSPTLAVFTPVFTTHLMLSRTFEGSSILTLMTIIREGTRQGLYCKDPDQMIKVLCVTMPESLLLLLCFHQSTNVKIDKLRNPTLVFTTHLMLQRTSPSGKTLTYRLGVRMVWNLPIFSLRKKVSGIHTLLASVIVRYFILPNIR